MSRVFLVLCLTPVGKVGELITGSTSVTGVSVIITAWDLAKESSCDYESRFMPVCTLAGIV
jgi:hypothetical protein